MIEVDNITKGFSVSFQIFELDYEDIDFFIPIFKNYKFSNEKKKGILEINKSKSFVEIDYGILESRMIEIFEKGQNNIKEFLTMKKIKILFEKGFLIYLGYFSELKKILNDLKNLTNLDIKRIILNKKKMEAIYQNFQSINQLGLHNERDPFIRTFRLKGDLTEKENWREFDNKDNELLEISGLYNTPFGPINLRISNDCRIQLYKGKIRINKELVIWFKNELIK